MAQRYLTILLVSVFMFSCSDEEKDFASKIESAHNKENFLSNEIIQFDLLLTFGGKERINGSMSLSTDSYKGILDKGNGEKIMYIGDKVYYSPNITDSAKVRFDAYTWSYFFLFPYKMNDEGTVWINYENKMLNEKEYQVEKLTFESGTGDAPDDWYVCYADKETNLLHAASYIVTYSKDVKTAEEDPHAIVYSNYQDFEGVPLARDWEFYGWKESIGLTEKLGDATLSNFRFLTKDEVDFSVPESFREI